MNRRFWVLVAVVALLAGLLGAAVPASAQTPSGASQMPANPEKIEQLLIRQGLLSVNATPEQKDAAVLAYLQLKNKGGGPDRNYNPLARKAVDHNEEVLNQLAASDIRGRKLGNRVEVPSSTPAFKPLVGRRQTPAHCRRLQRTALHLDSEGAGSSHDLRSSVQPDT